MLEVQGPNAGRFEPRRRFAGCSRRFAGGHIGAWQLVFGQFGHPGDAQDKECAKGLDYLNRRKFSRFFADSSRRRASDSTNDSPPHDLAARQSSLGPRQPPRMVGPAVVEAAGQLARVVAVGVHHPDSRRAAGGGAAKDDLPAVGRLAGTKVPHGGSLCVRATHSPSRGSSRQISVPPRASSGLKSRLKWSTSGRPAWYSQATFEPGRSARKQNAAVARPGGQVRSAAARLHDRRRSRRTTSPARVEHAMLAAVGPADAHVGPIVARMLAVMAIDVHDPLAVGRPSWCRSTGDRRIAATRTRFAPSTSLVHTW